MILLIVGRDVLGLLVPRLQHVRSYSSSRLGIQGNNWRAALGSYLREVKIFHVFWYMSTIMNPGQI